jgi:hypothetical protein
MFEKHDTKEHAHRSHQTQKTRPNTITNPTTPNTHAKAKTAIG